MQMTESEIEPLLTASERLVSETDIGFCRYLSGRIDWTDRLICIKGPKGAGIKMFGMLEAAELVRTVRSSLAEPKLKRLGTVEKVFLGDPNLMSALVPAPNAGAVRETYFANQLSCGGHAIVTPSQGDFLVDGKYLFEVGGKGKTFKQIADVPNSYVVNDDVEVGIGSKIPLWLFGFLY